MVDGRFLLNRLLVALLLVLALWTAGLFYLRRIWFFRDPVRQSPRDSEAILSPADGAVVYVRSFAGGQVRAEKLGTPIPILEITKASPSAGAGGVASEGWLIGVYMSPLDVHFNYSPTDGLVERIVHTPAALNLPMVDLWEYVRLTYMRQAVDLFAAKYRLVNERNTIFFRLDRPGGEVLRYVVVEIADKFVNKIDCFVKPGEAVRAGQKLSFIKRGSQVDLLLPRDAIRVLVKPGDRVIGGISIIARIDPSAVAAE